MQPHKILAYWRLCLADTSTIGLKKDHYKSDNLVKWENIEKGEIIAGQFFKGIPEKINEISILIAPIIAKTILEHTKRKLTQRKQ